MKSPSIYKLQLSTMLIYCCFFIVTLIGRPIVLHAQSLKELNTDNKKIFWGDLHTHSSLSYDAICPVDSIYYLAKYTYGLDFILVSDHDVGSTEADWLLAKARANYFNEPGSFVTFIGYEWTGHPGRNGGHRVVIFPGYDAPRFNYHSDEYNTVDKLISAVRRQNGIINIAHPDAPSNADIDLIQNDVQRGIEFVGYNNRRYEFYGNNRAHPLQIENNSVRDALEKGHLVGAIGGSDTHEGKPGSGGITAVFADTLTREAIFNSIKNRQVYATTGARIRLSFYSENLNMGDVYVFNSNELPLSSPEFYFSIHGTTELSQVQIIRNSEVVYEVNNINSKYHTAGFKDFDYITDNTYYYLRVLQKDGHMAWSSPVFFQDKRFFMNIPQNQDYYVNSYFLADRNEIGITLYLAEGAFVKLMLYDYLMKKTWFLKSEFFDSGIHQFTFNCADLASGIYLLNMQTPELTKTTKTLVIR